MAASPQQAAEELLKRRAVRNSLAEWARYKGFEPAPHHKLIIDTIEEFLDSDEQVLLLFAPPGSAKALTLDTPIPTPLGWSEMGALKVGDQVFDENGRPCNVIRVSEIYRDRPVYTVRTDCGDEIIADADHEWLVRLCGKSRVGKRHEPRPFKLKTTKYLCRRRAKRPMVVRARGLDLPPASLPIDPYLLGVWLGDGNSAGMRITSDLKDQKWLRAELEGLGYQTSNSSVPTLFGILGVRHLFVGLGLIHDPGHSTYGRKYIPTMYMRSSYDQRLSLLQGLIDTDGTVCKKRGCATFCNTNLALAEDVRELVRSLGRKAGWSEGRAILNGVDCGPVYRVSFFHSEAARMPRKRKLCRDQERTPNTYIEVEPAGTADTVCIEVDSPSHLYLCGRSMTPTHNSTYISILLPSWYLARHPNSAILAATHSVEFAERWGRRVRSDIASEGKILGVELSVENQAAARWALTAGGEYYGVGAGVGISGFRADLGIGDDFFGNREDAYSNTVRNKRWDWYVSDFSARLKPGAKRILINTRWHEEDVAGRVLQQIEKGVVRGRSLSITAQAEDSDPLGRDPGAYLWDDPGGYDYGQFLRDRKREESPMMWAALYQQRPAPEEGDYFRAEWLKTYEHLPAVNLMRIYGASDYAVTTDGGDYTVHIVVGVDPDNRMYVLDLWRGQAATDTWVEVLCDLVAKWKPIEWGEETGQITSGMGPYIKRRQIERDAFVYRRQFSAKHDKSVRAQSIRGRMALHGLYLPFDAPWLSAFRSELLGFPAGKHDDQADALGLIGQLLDHVTRGNVPQIKPATKPTQLIFTALPNGKLVANMTIFEIAENKRKAREALRP